MLRRRGYQGALAILSDDPDLPCDRPNLSKDFLAGKVPEKWIPLKSRKFYERRDIDLQLGTRVEWIDTDGRIVRTADGREFPFDRLLLATGAEPVRLPIPGADQDHVRTLRSFADSRAIIARAEQAKTAVVLGSGFIGLEVAAALCKRGLKVHVISRDERPLEKVLGPELGDFIRQLHEEKGEVFHMKNSIACVGAGEVTLDDGSRIPADLVILGVGVKPRVSLAEGAGLKVDHGVIVDEHLETGAPGIFAAGDIARWPDAISGETQRIEHWVVAERQGQTVAENMLGARQPYRDVLFCWSAHHGVSIRYVGHAQGWDALEIDGDIAARDCLVRYRKDGRTAAIAAIGRDRQALECEAEMESGRR
ncbi:MAG TPA: FAD-dependent oxidoreductase [Paracoccus sp. (in: a-proteobacteria)]|nr:FAD-dependent oxidoreductase [Paracoccus sp. (in: a-proteobacteria)]